MTIALIIIGWLACGVVACGFGFAHLQRPDLWTRKQEFYKDRFITTSMIIFGIPSLITIYFHTFGFKAGWLWPWSAKAKREAGL